MTASAKPNNVIRDTRENQFRMSRSEFARHINITAAAIGENTGCTPRLIAAWEAGTVASPRPVYERVLHEITGRGLQDLGFAARRSTAATVPALPYGQKAKESDVERRIFLLDSAGSVAGAAFGLRHPTDSDRRLGMREIRSVVATTNALEAYDRERGSVTIHRQAAETLNTAYEWLNRGHFNERTGRLLRSATGTLSVAVGWLAFDSGRHADARSHYNEALAIARLAQDPGLEAQIFGCLSSLARADRRPREVVSTAQAARSIAKPLSSPRMEALFAMREANGWALLGDRGACDGAITDAHAHYAKGPRDNDPAWLDFFTPGELAGLESLCRAGLGQHERSAHGAEQAVLLHGNAFARNRALVTTRIAVGHALRDRPDLDAAVHAADKALAYLPDVQSTRLLERLGDVETALYPHAKAPLVADWLDKYRAITAA